MSTKEGRNLWNSNRNSVNLIYSLETATIPQISLIFRPRIFAFDNDLWEEFGIYEHFSWNARFRKNFGNIGGILGLSEVRSWSFGEHSSIYCGIMLFHSGKPDGTKHDSKIKSMLTVSARCVLKSDRILFAILRFRICIAIYPLVHLGPTR